MPDPNESAPNASWPRRKPTGGGASTEAKSRACVETSLALRRAHPMVPAIEVLDIAMQPLVGGDPDFTDAAAAGGDWTDPRTEFGDLIRLAFGQGMALSEVLAASADVGGDLCDAFLEHWSAQPMVRFADHYLLWGSDLGEAERHGGNAAGIALMQALLDMRKAQPELAALQLFDAVMEPRRGTGPQFGLAFQASGPLSSLFERAFPMARTPLDHDWLNDESRSDEARGEVAESLMWQAFARFFDRYDFDAE